MLIEQVINSKRSNEEGKLCLNYELGNKKANLFYARETRVFNGKLSDKGYPVKTGGWFTNYIAFDFDPDEKRWGKLDDYEERLNTELNKLETILGKPYVIIRNKSYEELNKLDKYTLDFIFGEKRNFPKPLGCQVIYRLTSSVKANSVMDDSWKMYQAVRKYITSLVNSDPEFQGNMVKNWYNTKIFNVTKNENDTRLDVNKFFFDNNLTITNKEDSGLDIYETINKVVRNTAIKLNNIYAFDKDYKRSYYKTESRNRTTFNYLMSLSDEEVLSCRPEDLIGSVDFTGCNEESELSVEEYAAIIHSVRTIRKSNSSLNGYKVVGSRLGNQKRLFETTTFNSIWMSNDSCKRVIEEIIWNNNNPYDMFVTIINGKNVFNKEIINDILTQYNTVEIVTLFRNEVTKVWYQMIDQKNKEVTNYLSNKEFGISIVNFAKNNDIYNFINKTNTIFKNSANATEMSKTLIEEYKMTRVDARYVSNKAFSICDRKTIFKNALKEKDFSTIFKLIRKAKKVIDVTNRNAFSKYFGIRVSTATLLINWFKNIFNIIVENRIKVYGNKIENVVLNVIDLNKTIYDYFFLIFRNINEFYFKEHVPKLIYKVV